MLMLFEPQRGVLTSAQGNALGWLGSPLRGWGHAGMFTQGVVRAGLDRPFGATDTGIYLSSDARKYHVQIYQRPQDN